MKAKSRLKMTPNAKIVFKQSHQVIRHGENVPSRVRRAQKVNFLFFLVLRDSFSWRPLVRLQEKYINKSAAHYSPQKGSL